MSIAIYNGIISGGSSSVLAVIATILMSETVLAAMARLMEIGVNSFPLKQGEDKVM